MRTKTKVQLIITGAFVLGFCTLSLISPTEKAWLQVKSVRAERASQRLEKLPDNVSMLACSPAAISLGQTINSQLDTTDCVDNGFRYDVYTFNAVVGQKISISYSSSAFDTTLFLADSGNTIIAGDDNSGGGTNSRIPVGTGFAVLAKTGLYQIVVTTKASGSQGPYSLTLADGNICPKTPISLGQSVSSFFDLPCTDIGGFANKYYSFSGTVGQQISVHLRSFDFDPYVLLQDVNGNTIASNDNSGGGINARIPDLDYLTLPTTGTYLIVVSSSLPATNGPFTLSLVSQPISQPVPKADYRFAESLASSVGGAPNLSNLTGSVGTNFFETDTVDGYARPTLRFPENSGLSLNTGGLIPNNAYSVVILFKMDELTGPRRVLDVTNGTNDSCGAYIRDFRFETELTTTTPIRPSTYIQVVIIREASGRVRAYREGVLRVDLPNDSGCFQIASNVMRFFQDDTQVGNEASAGNVARIRLYDVIFTPQQVRDLSRLPLGGESGSQELYVLSGRDNFGEIYRMNADGGFQVRQTFTNTYDELVPSLSPDGRKVVFYDNALSTNNQIYIGDVAGTATPVRLTNTATTIGDQHPKWSPDGSKILFSRCDSVTFVCDLFVMNANGTNLVNLTPGTTTDEDQGNWSPDGSKIIFTSNRNGGVFNLFTMNAAGTNVQQLTNVTNSFDTSAVSVYSPDGSKIAFAGKRNATSSTEDLEIFVINANGSGLLQLTNNAHTDYRPLWAPDGQKLAYYSTTPGGTNTDVFTINADGTNEAQITYSSTTNYPFAWRPVEISTRTLFDYDGDGRADLSVRRPSDNIWYILRGTAGYFNITFGEPGDLIAPADYDGDGKTDVCVFRPSNGTWYMFNSQSQSFTTTGWGANGDLPVPADHDGDGRADMVVFRPSTNTWYTRFANGTFSTTAFGVAGDKPVVGDFDGDGRADIALFRPSDSNWYILKTGFGFFVQTWGQTGDIPVPADYDGDGVTDVAVFRPSTGQWFRIRSTAGFDIVNWGANGDKPIPADYDGDGKADVAVFRSSNSTWYIVGSMSGQLIQQYGVAGDVPTQGAFIY